MEAGNPPDTVGLSASLPTAANGTERETRVGERLRAAFDQFDDAYLPKGGEDAWLMRQRLGRLCADAVRIAISEGAT